MSRPRFLADEDFRFEIVSAVLRVEPSIHLVTVQSAGLSGMKDPELLKYADHESLILLSHDVNTLKAEAELRLRNSQSIAGLFLAAQRSETRVIADSIRMVWDASDHEEWRDRIVFLPI